jgi:hypothetical protein
MAGRLASLMIVVIMISNFVTFHYLIKIFVFKHSFTFFRMYMRYGRNSNFLIIIITHLLPEIRCGPSHTVSRCRLFYNRSVSLTTMMIDIGPPVNCLSLLMNNTFLRCFIFSGFVAHLKVGLFCVNFCRTI